MNDGCLFYALDKEKGDCMVHFLIKVPSDGEASTTHEVLVFRLESFNDNSRYLLYDSGDETEMRFILVCEDEISEKTQEKLKSIFRKDVEAEEISIESIDQKTLSKILVARKLMVDDVNCCGKKKYLFTTKNSSQLLETAGAAVSAKEFTKFLVEYTDYIDRTADIAVNSMHNVVIINDHDVNLEPYIELLYGIMAAKGLLIEHIMIHGNMSDLRHTNRETQCVYVIEDEWELDDNDDYFPLSAHEQLLNAIFGEESFSAASLRTDLLTKIKDSNNIYIAPMKQDEYYKMVKHDLFSVAFPLVVTIGELNVFDKIRSICSIAGEYGFTVDEEGFADNRLISATSMDDIEIAVRKVVQQKLIAKEKSFIFTMSDLTIKEVNAQKTSAFDELESLIGLNGVKKTIKEIVALLEKRGKNAVPCLHMAFLGNPGTGKTTVARIIAKLFAEVGLTKKDLLVETQRGGLVGKYLGHTAQKTALVIKSALGGVLFIDEAYSLIERHDDAYGKEAIATLVKIMEDKRDEFVCILAGYTEDMNAMLDVNPGLRDRIQFHINFPDYNISELMQIFEKFCKENAYKLSRPARAALEDGITRIVGAKSHNFSNGRLVRKIFERVRIKQAFRATDDTITKSDVQEAFAETDIANLFGNERMAIGFRLSA